MIDVESDIISCLPDHLIDLILSHLSIKEAVRTSVLSSNWRKKWSTLPDLVFDIQCVSTETSEDPSVIESKFLRIVDHVLLLHSGPINKFEVSDSYQYLTIGVNSMADIDGWIFQISKRYIKELVLDIRLKQRYKIPLCLFSCQSLHHLKLNYCCLEPPTTFEGFRNLKSLSMSEVTITQDAFVNMISGCPLLEKLTLDEIDDLWLTPPTTFEGFRNLKSLSMSVITMTQDAFENMISGCPLLEKLKLEEIDGLTQINIRAPNLKDFEICDKFESINFDNTFQLAMVQNAKKNDLLTPVSCCWEDMFSGPLMPLKVQHVWIGQISGTKFELDFVKFLLRYSPVLEKMTVVPISKVKTKVMTELIRLKSASRQVEVIYHD